MDLVITNCQPTSLHYEKVLLKKICLFKRVLYASPVCSVNEKTPFTCVVHEYTKATDRFPDWHDIIFGN